MNLAGHVSEWSKDPSTKVGAVVIDSEKRVVGLGYNGFPRGVLDSPERYNERHVKYKLIVHAEANALLNAHPFNIVGCSLYTTIFPCAECTKLIIQAGISNVYYRGVIERANWQEEIELSTMMMTEAGVMVWKHDIV